MRLIDADKLLMLINEQKEKETGSYSKGRNEGLNIAKSIINDEIQTPIAYDVDKVVEQLEEVKKKATELCLAINDGAQRLKYIEKEQTIALAIEIVKAGGKDE